MIEVPKTSLALITVTVMLGVLLGVMDSAIVNVAIPTISGNLGAAPDLGAWVATGYTLGMMIVMPLNGWLTNRLGQKNYYLAALGLFTIMSMLCGLATSIGELIVFRVIQGFGGGALQPIALAILLKSAPPERRGDMVAAFSFASLAPFAAGPVIGGYLLDNYEGWQILFLFKVPICVLGIVAAWFLLPRDRADRVHQPLQFSGLALLATALTSIQFVLSRGQQEDWFDSERIVAFTLVAVCAWTAFVWTQLRATSPLVNLRIFKTVSFAVGCIVTVVSGFGLYAINLVTPLFFQGPLHLSPYQTGIFLLQGTVATMLVIPLIGPLTRRVDARLVIGSGLALFAIGAWLMGGLNAGAGYWDIFFPRILQGVALGFLFVPLIAVTLSQIGPSTMSDATGIATLVRYLGGNIGIAILQVLQVRRAATITAILAATTTLRNPAITRLADGYGLERARHMLAGMVAAEANDISYLYVFRVAALLFVATIPLLVLLPDPRPSRNDSTSDVDVEVADEFASITPIGRRPLEGVRSIT
jgi:DHA2 family multidrug resistance protein